MIIKWAKKREKHHFGRTLVSIRSKIEKTPFLVRLWLKEGQNRKKIVSALVRIRAKIPFVARLW